jgi:hypothetical protein
MHNLKVLAIIGLAGVLAGAWVTSAVAAIETTIEISGQAQACNFTIQVNGKEVQVALTGKETIREVRDLTVQTLNTIPGVSAKADAIVDNRFSVTVESFEIVPLGQSAVALSKVGDHAQACGLTFTVVAVGPGPVPTLTQWGLIALGVLLAGSMGFVLYRSRPTARPALP